MRRDTLWNSKVCLPGVPLRSFHVADYVISYTLCCRNPDATLVDPTADSFYIPIHFDNLDAPGNNTPLL